MAPCPAELSEVHDTDVPAPQLPQQPEVAHPEISVPRSDCPNGLPPRIVRLVGLVRAAGAEAARAAAALIIRAAARAAAPPAMDRVADLGAATAIADAAGSGIADPGDQEAVLGFGALSLAADAATEGALVILASRRGPRSRFAVASRAGCRCFNKGKAGTADGMSIDLVLLGRRDLHQEKRGRAGGIDLGAARVVTARVLVVIGATSVDSAGILLSGALRGIAGFRESRFDDEAGVLSGGGAGGRRHIINPPREREGGRGFL